MSSPEPSPAEVAALEGDKEFRHRQDNSRRSFRKRSGEDEGNSDEDRSIGYGKRGSRREKGSASPLRGRDAVPTKKLVAAREDENRDVGSRLPRSDREDNWAGRDGRNDRDCWSSRSGDGYYGGRRGGGRRGRGGPYNDYDSPRFARGGRRPWGDDGYVKGYDRDGYDRDGWSGYEYDEYGGRHGRGRGWGRGGYQQRGRGRYGEEYSGRGSSYYGPAYYDRYDHDDKYSGPPRVSGNRGGRWGDHYGDDGGRGYGRGRGWDPSRGRARGFGGGRYSDHWRFGASHAEAKTAVDDDRWNPDADYDDEFEAYSPPPRDRDGRQEGRADDRRTASGSRSRAASHDGGDRTAGARTVPAGRCPRGYRIEEQEGTVGSDRDGTVERGDRNKQSSQRTSPASRCDADAGNKSQHEVEQPDKPSHGGNGRRTAESAGERPTGKPAGGKSASKKPKPAASHGMSEGGNSGGGQVLPGLATCSAKKQDGSARFGKKPHKSVGTSEDLSGSDSDMPAQKRKHGSSVTEVHPPGSREPNGKAAAKETHVNSQDANSDEEAANDADQPVKEAKTLSTRRSKTNKEDLHEKEPRRQIGQAAEKAHSDTPQQIDELYSPSEHGPTQDYKHLCAEGRKGRALLPNQGHNSDTDKPPFDDCRPERDGKIRHQQHEQGAAALGWKATKGKLRTRAGSPAAQEEEEVAADKGVVIVSTGRWGDTEKLFDATATRRVSRVQDQVPEHDMDDLGRAKELVLPLQSALNPNHVGMGEGATDLDVEESRTTAAAFHTAAVVESQCAKVGLNVPSERVKEKEKEKAYNGVPATVENHDKVNTDSSMIGSDAGLNGRTSKRKPVDALEADIENDRKKLVRVARDAGVNTELDVNVAITTAVSRPVPVMKDACCGTHSAGWTNKDLPVERRAMEDESVSIGKVKGSSKVAQPADAAGKESQPDGKQPADDQAEASIKALNRQTLQQGNKDGNMLAAPSQSSPRGNKAAAASLHSTEDKTRRRSKTCVTPRSRSSSSESSSSKASSSSSDDQSNHKLKCSSGKPTSKPEGDRAVSQPVAFDNTEDTTVAAKDPIVGKDGGVAKNSKLAAGGSSRRSSPSTRQTRSSYSNSSSRSHSSRSRSSSSSGSPSRSRGRQRRIPTRRRGPKRSGSPSRSRSSRSQSSSPSGRGRSHSRSRSPSGRSYSRSRSPSRRGGRGGGEHRGRGRKSSRSRSRSPMHRSDMQGHGRRAYGGRGFGRGRGRAFVDPRHGGYDRGYDRVGYDDYDYGRRGSPNGYRMDDRQPGGRGWHGFPHDGRGRGPRGRGRYGWNDGDGRHYGGWGGRGDYNREYRRDGRGDFNDKNRGHFDREDRDDERPRHQYSLDGEEGRRGRRSDDDRDSEQQGRKDVEKQHRDKQRAAHQSPDRGGKQVGSNFDPRARDEDRHRDKDANDVCGRIQGKSPSSNNGDARRADQDAAGTVEGGSSGVGDKDRKEAGSGSPQSSGKVDKAGKVTAENESPLRRGLVEDYSDDDEPSKEQNIKEDTNIAEGSPRHPDSRPERPPTRDHDLGPPEAGPRGYRGQDDLGPRRDFGYGRGGPGRRGGRGGYYDDRGRRDFRDSPYRNSPHRDGPPYRNSPYRDGPQYGRGGRGPHQEWRQRGPPRDFRDAGRGDRGRDFRDLSVDRGGLGHRRDAERYPVRRKDDRRRRDDRSRSHSRLRSESPLRSRSPKRRDRGRSSRRDESSSPSLSRDDKRQRKDDASEDSRPSSESSKKPRTSAFTTAPAQGIASADIVKAMMAGPGGKTGLTVDQKKKLLWGGKKVAASTEEEPVTEAAKVFGANRWDCSEFKTDQDKSKFLSLMGVKADPSTLPSSGVTSEDEATRKAMNKEQERKVLQDVEQHFVAGLRRADGRHVGLGL